MIILKKTFQIIGLIGIVCFSFFITEKTTNVVKKVDDIMISIKENMSEYERESKDAEIIDDSIIPGISGREVNVEKSYKNMRKNGYYSDKLFIYNYIKPNISLNDNKDKYIIKGPADKRMVSLLFIVDDENIDSIISILDNYKISANFFISNTTSLDDLINKNHIIGLNVIDSNSISYIDNAVKSLNKQSNGFCIASNDYKQLCLDLDNYLIKPTYINDNILENVKKEVESGSILAFRINRELKKDLSNIIIYLKNKGYNIDNLNNHVLEI